MTSAGEERFVPASVAIAQVMPVIAAVECGTWIIQGAVILAVDPQLFTSPWLTFAGLCVLGVAVVLISTRRVPRVVPLALAAAVTWALLLNVADPGTPASSVIEIPLLSQVAVLAAFLIRPGAGYAVVVSVEVLGGAILLLGAARAGNAHAAIGILVAGVGRGVALGLAVVWMAGVLLAAAKRVDDVAAALVRAGRAESEARALKEQATRSTHLLHDTVVNTLGVIRQGVPEGDEGRLRARCRHDLAQLEDLSRLDHLHPERNSIDRLAAAAAEKARLVGVDARIQVQGPSREIPADALDALTFAVREGLINVAKHSGVASAVVDIDTCVSGVAVSVTDSGRGFAGDAGTAGVGASVMRRCERFGIDVEVVAGPNRGTALTLVWADPRGRTRDQVFPSLAATTLPVLARMAVPLVALAWLLVGFSIITGAIDPSLPILVPQVAALILMTGCAGAALFAVRAGGMLSTPATVGVILLLVGTAHVATITGTPCRLGTGSWAPVAGQVGLVLVTLLAPRLVWAMVMWIGYVIVVGSAALVTPDTAGCGVSGLPAFGLNAVLFATLVVARIGLDRYGHRVAAASELHARSEAAAAALAATREAQLVRVDRSMRHAAPFFTAIAAGEMNLRSSETRLRAAELEDFTRAVASMPELPEVAEGVLLRLVEACFERGISVRIATVSSDADIDGVVAGSIDDAGRVIVEGLSAPAQVHVSLSCGTESGELTLVVHSPLDIDLPATLPGLRIDQREAAGDTIIRLAWPCEGDGAAEESDALPRTRGVPLAES